jgi:hypothetical protein
MVRRRNTGRHLAHLSVKVELHLETGSLTGDRVCRVVREDTAERDEEPSLRDHGGLEKRASSERPTRHSPHRVLVEHLLQRLLGLLPHGICKAARGRQTGV